MPPKTVAMPSPSGSSPSDGAQDDELIAAIRAHQAKATRAHLKKQQALLSRATELTSSYKDEVQKILSEEQTALYVRFPSQRPVGLTKSKASRKKRTQEYQAHEAGLKKQIEETEKELLVLLQEEASTVQLAAAAIQAEQQDAKADNAAVVGRMEKLVEEEAKGIDAAIQGMWEMGEVGGGGDEVAEGGGGERMEE
ncbi:hypothetical protein JCM10213v2_009224 [Rhodosporidiobolus nylandii]